MVNYLVPNPHVLVLLEFRTLLVLREEKRVDAAENDGGSADVEEDILPDSV